MSGPTRLTNRAEVSGVWPSFLWICDEWLPTRGGISRFNRGLAITSAAAGHRTTCLVRSASDQERLDAKAHDVKLVTAARTPAGPNLYVALEEVLAECPDVVVGHDVITGSIAQTYARTYLKSAKLVLVVHNAPARCEPLKRTTDAARRTEQHEAELRDVAADVVAAVGPKLAVEADGIVGDGFGGVSVLQLDPGMNIPALDLRRRRKAPAQPTIVMITRTKHIEPKGLDIAAKAVAGLTVPHGRPLPDLLIRGAEPGTTDDVRRKLDALSGLPRGRITVHEYTPDFQRIESELRRAALCVMPSRTEGFGLVALEAIAAGTPVLVSDKSGVAQTLSDRLGHFADPMIVEVTDDFEQDTEVWRRRMQRVLDDLPTAFDYAHEVRAPLAPRLRWESALNVLVNRLRSCPADVSVRGAGSR